MNGFSLHIEPPSYVTENKDKCLDIYTCQVSCPLPLHASSKPSNLPIRIKILVAIQQIVYIYLHDSCVEPQISHFANFTPCEELVTKRHFWKM